MRRLAVTVEGTVQGVGFRPFVYAAATSRGLSGWVRNGADAVRLEVQGPDEKVQGFLDALRSPPAAARVDRIDAHDLPVGLPGGFEILASALAKGTTRPTLPADLGICRECTAEMDDPRARRHRYPFTNCTQCGPRYSIALALPYDRSHTSMKGFQLCAACVAEYAEPRDRRFHAQPIACPACGPSVRLVSPSGADLADGRAAIDEAARMLLRGDVLALKGLGGFQLLVDATSQAAVAKLRERKRREEKPFAVMFPSAEAARESCLLSEDDETALGSVQAPILLVRRRHEGCQVAAGVAPRNPWLGVMLPYTPLHRLLLAATGCPLVCTSGNLSEDPMCTDEREARERLDGIADCFLVHDRPIVRPIDDSVARIDSRGLQILRRARGFAPLALRLPGADSRCILATGAQQKSTVALATGGDVVVSQHLGDLFTAEGVALLERTALDLMRFFDAEPELIACDLHPDYASTRLAEKLSSLFRVPVERVQHHHAHIAACVAEHGLKGPVLGLAWDGAGLGTDGTIWGGEALVVDGASCRRVAHLRPFSLPGGEAAMREPWRSALGLLFEISGRGAVEHVEMEPSRARTLLSMLDARVACPRTSSMGRLFDAVAFLTGVRERAGYEGQAAVELEHAADGVTDRVAYPLLLRPGEPAVADWEPLVRALLRDRARHVPTGVMSARFHDALVDLAESVALRVGLPQVVLSGGCFQNLRLIESVRQRLSARGFDVRSPRKYPPNDGGISLGQLHVAACRRDSGDVPRHTG